MCHKELQYPLWEYSSWKKLCLDFILEILGPLVGRFSLQEVHLFELPIVILIFIFRIVIIFSPCLEEFALLRGVTFIFTMERAIK